MARPALAARARAALIVLLAAPVALATAAAPASAATYCVNTAAGACTDTSGVTLTGTPAQRLQQALTAAATSAVDDTIALGAGDYDKASTFNYDTPGVPAATTGGKLTVRGAGRSVTNLRNTGTTLDDETLEGQDDSGTLVLEDLTIHGPAAANRSLGIELGFPGSALTRVDVIGTPASGAPAQALLAGVFARGAAPTVGGTQAWSATLTDVHIRGFSRGLSTFDEATSGGAANRHVVVDRATIAGGARGALRVAGRAAVTNAVLTTASGSTAVVVECGGDANLTHVTLAAPQPALGTQVSCATGGQTAKITFRASIIAQGTSGSSLYGSDGPAQAATTFVDSRVDGSTTPGTANGVTRSGKLTNAAPGFVSATDFHLAAGSPLIDFFEGAALSAHDRDGAARPLDGDGDGTARPDLGAYEAAAIGGPTTPTEPTEPTQPTEPTTPTQPGPGPTQPGPGPADPGPGGSPDPNPGTGGGTGPPVTPEPAPQPGTPPTQVPETQPVPAHPGVRLTGGSLRADAKGRVTVAVKCLATGAVRCTGELAILRTTGKGTKAKTTTLGRAKLNLKAGRSAKVVVTLSAAGRRALTAAGLKASARAVVRDGTSTALAATTVNRALTLLAPRRR